MTKRRTLATLGALVLTLAASSAALAQTPISFGKSFSPSTIGPGSVSTLEFDLVNNTSNPASNVAFTDSLPAGVTVASPANVSSSCGGTVSAAGGSISLSGGQLAAGGSCSIGVDVTSGTGGTYTNTTGAISSSVGGGDTATADLTVDVARPGFRKGFSPGTVVFGGRSTLTLTIDNSANGTGAANLSFSDTLPTGMILASPANASTSCGGGSLTATAGGSVISYAPAFFGDATVAANSTCTVTAEVLGNGVGALGNTTGELTSTPPTGSPSRSSGKAGAVLTVSATRLVLTKEFVDDPAPPGGTVELAFTILNLDRGLAATQLVFGDDLGAALSGLDVTGTLPDDPCGAGSALTSAGGVLTLVDGNLPAEGSCTFAVTLQVPAAAAAGAYTNTTTAISGNVGGAPESGDPATDVLFVEPAPRLTKTFLPGAVAAGESVEIEFTITNTDPASSLSGIAFVDELTDNSGGLGGGSTGNGFLPFPVSVTLPPNPDPPCGPGSSVALVSLGTDRQGLSLSGASLGAAGGGSDSCTFTVAVDIPAGLAAADYLNTTEEITATTDTTDETVTGPPASDTLRVVAAPVLLKEFIDDPAQAGGTTTLRFTLTYDANGDGFVDADVVDGASAITFTDNLTATLAGLEATGLPANDVCGAGSVLSGTSTITLTGGSLNPDTGPNPDPATFSCSFDVSLQVPAAALPGSYANTTSAVQATVSGRTATGGAASDDLRIAGLELGKQFVDDPVVAGGQITLRYTIDNSSPTEGAASIFFTDNLDAAVDNLAATGLPLNDICGTGSSLTGTTNLTFQAGSLGAGESCTFDVTLDVPAGTASDTYGSITSSPTAAVGGQSVAFDPAFDELTVASDLLSLGKEFIDDPAAPGGSVTLEFTITNLDPAGAASGIAFSDDLDAALPGLASSSGTLTDVCGAGSQISGTSLLAFSGGSLAGGASCTFAVTLDVPGDAALGTSATNTTSEVTGTIGGLSVTGDPASDDLEISVVEFTKAFGGAPAVGGTATLTFTIQNVSATQSVDDLSFTDDLDAVVAGLVATGLPANDVCGSGSLVFGSSLISLTGGNLPPLGSCSIVVNLSVPDSPTAPGDYENVTSDLRAGELVAAAPAIATLTLAPDQDIDNDGVANDVDNCPSIPNPDQSDNDGDGSGDVCDDDDDNDGVLDGADNCQFDVNTDQADNDFDGFGDVCDDDDDNDGVLDGDDNCQFDANPDQADNDNDGQGDVCDPDDDNDGVLDGDDNCQFDANPDQANNDGDGFGDVCDDDDDNDTVADVDDNCPFTANTDQTDTDGDGFGDACDDDDDNDTILDDVDNCPFTANTDQADQDGDGIGDVCDDDRDGDGVLDANDNCPATPNPDQTDTDGDGQGDACDDDDDNDGVLDGDDNCDLIANPDQADNDFDGFGDVCDDDDDNDGVEDGVDNCPFTANTDQADNDNDGQGDVCDDDDDNDGVEDGVDNCQFDANPDQANNDGDGFGDVCDPDDDNDGVDDTVDNCQFTSNPDQSDNDGDGFGDACDDDDDNDGVNDDVDNCPFAANADQADNDNDGQGDVCDPDDDNDGVDDGDDNCPFTSNPDQTDTDGDGLGDACDPDDDDDGVLDGDDVCAGTVIPEPVPLSGTLKNNRYALTTMNVPDPLTFEDTANNGPVLTTADTGGCSCYQIATALGLGQPQFDFGCSQSNMESWIDGLGSPLQGANGRGDAPAREAAPREDTLRGPGLEVRIVGPGAVTSDPKRWLGDRMLGLACAGGTCRVKFEAGTEVTLMARPDAAARFARWDGDCYGNQPITTVTVDQETACTAIFESSK